MSTFIDNVVSYDATVFVSLNNHTPRYVPNDSIPNDGYIRVNNGKFEYWDGKYQHWMPCSGSDIAIDSGPVIRNFIEWAEKKMVEEQRIAKLAEEYPALKSAKENYELIKAMVDKDV